MGNTVDVLSVLMIFCCWHILWMPWGACLKYVKSLQMLNLTVTSQWLCKPVLIIMRCVSNCLFVVVSYIQYVSSVKYLGVFLAAHKKI